MIRLFAGFGSVKTGLAKIGLAALVALSGLAATQTTASAASNGPAFVTQIQYHERHHGRDWRPDHRRHDHRRQGCSPWRAEAKAERMGLRRVRVVDVSRRTVTVVGRDRHGRDRIVFANQRGCPIIRR